MKAFILAAGLGTRLRPLTNSKPKALVEVAGKTMLERALEQITKIGIKEIVINTHHLAEQIENLITAYSTKRPDLKIELVREKELLETGGALKNVESFFKGSGPLLVHNVDIIHNFDLKQIIKAFDKNCLALLAVKNQPTSRPFLIDEENNVCGHQNKNNGETHMLLKSKGQLKEMRFCGIHLISDKIFDLLETGKYSIINKYLELIANGFIIKAFDVGAADYFDLGSAEKITEAENFILNLPAN